MVTISVEFRPKLEPPSHETEATHLEFGKVVQVRPKAVTEGRPLVPGELLVGFVRDGRFRVHRPFAVKLEAENNDIIAEAPEFNEFGFGKNASDALADLQRAVVELYLALEQEQQRLGPDLLQTWQTLQKHIAKR